MVEGDVGRRGDRGLHAAIAVATDAHDLAAADRVHGHFQYVLAVTQRAGDAHEEAELGVAAHLRRTDLDLQHFAQVVEGLRMQGVAAARTPAQAAAAFFIGVVPHVAVGDHVGHRRGDLHGMDEGAGGIDMRECLHQARDIREVAGDHRPGAPRGMVPDVLGAAVGAHRKLAGRSADPVPTAGGVSHDLIHHGGGEAHDFRGPVHPGGGALQVIERLVVAHPHAGPFQDLQAGLMDFFQGLRFPGVQNAMQ